MKNVHDMIHTMATVRVWKKLRSRVEEYAKGEGYDLAADYVFVNTHLSLWDVLITEDFSGPTVLSRF